MPNEAPSLAPPYVGYGVFKSTTEQLAESVVPTGPLDRRVLSWLSGADYPALMSALRFLDLVDDERKATADYRRLVEVVKRPDDWKIELLAVLMSKYEPIVGNLDVQHGGTIGQLEKAFKDYGVSAGQMLGKTIRFYLKALADAKVPISPHIAKAKPKVPRTRTNSDKARTRTPKVGANTEEQHPHGRSAADPIPQGFERLPIPGMVDSFIQYPVGLTFAQCGLLEGAVAFLKIYAGKGSVGAKETKP